MMGDQKIYVRRPYYATQCEHCGWLGSSEDLNVHRYHDDADMSCPECSEIVAGDDPEERFMGRFVFEEDD